jgi:Dyp-type peroxidase family
MGLVRLDAELPDIQGNILHGYRSFPHARFLFFKIEKNKPEAGRAFINSLLTGKPTTVTRGKWLSKPLVTTNIAFTFRGLAALHLDAQCLASFPPEFQQGMKQRARLLGDVGLSDPRHWHEPWHSSSDDVHILVSCYASDSAKLDDHCQKLLLGCPPGVEAIRNPPHQQGAPPLQQDAARLVVNGKPSRVEHFGFEDGLSNPAIEGVRDAGGGTGNPEAPLGEFILGHRAEGGEVAPMPAPRALARNGSFLVLRKLEQDVLEFRKFVREQAVLLKQALGSTFPAETTAEEFLAAKMMGRWRDGSPLDLYPTKPANDKSNKFSYAEDPHGAFCPLGAHTRRANPRASLGFAGLLVRRRRLIRRGIPYGPYLPDNADADDGASRGIIFQAFNASIERQFEFVQRQWINYGDALRQGDDTDPIAGSRYRDGRIVAAHGDPFDRIKDSTGQWAKGRMVIPGDQLSRRPPFLCFDIPNFVTTKGGDYFFVPSLTGLRLLASGKVFV